MKRLLLLIALTLSASAAHAQSSIEEIHSALDSLHNMASKANFDAYFGLYTPDAIFLGTDATERWTIDQFKGYAKPSFDAGRGWTYIPKQRHVFVSPDGNTAWFDEMLDNDGFGECRGTGVLIQKNGEWKIAQYHLTVPIPNDLLRSVAGQIKNHSSQ